MAYVTGSAGNFNDLLLAFQQACTANDWTLTGAVLSKGACVMQLGIAGNYLSLLGGTGIDSQGALVAPGPMTAAIGPIWSTEPFGFPLTYEVHVLTAPDEVYLVVNYAVDRFQWLAFGCSPVPGLPGTGNWYGASLGQITPYYYAISMGLTNGATYPNSIAPALFWNSNAYDGRSSVFHHGLDGGGWTWGQGYNYGVTAADALTALNPCLSRQPNTWNGETVLLPIQPLIGRPSNKVSIVGDLAHARYLRNDNLGPGQVIALGPDRWKTYPWYRKNASARDGTNYNGTDSGTLGWAVRYTGP